MIGCIEPYNPPLLDNQKPILIIDGFININGQSQIMLSRSQSLNDNSETLFESGADVWVEDEFNNELHFFESATGIYLLEEHTLPAPRYRLRLRTNNADEYASDFVTKIETPQIDSVTWNLTDTDNIEIFVSTHDNNFTNRYYRWSFDETWEYRSFLNSQYTFDDINKIINFKNENIYTCWRSFLSSSINVESTIRFAENRVSNFQLKSFKRDDERVRLKYSILVKQYSLTKDAYDYWLQLKKINQDLGTIFGPLPSEVKGNFRNIKVESEPVIGFFSVGSVTENRIYIKNSDFPPPPIWNTPYRGCEYDTLFIDKIPEFSLGSYLIGGELYQGDRLIGYSYSINFCVDCRMSGGSNVKPEFWQ